MLSLGEPPREGDAPVRRRGWDEIREMLGISMSALAFVYGISWE